MGELRRAVDAGAPKGEVGRRLGSDLADKRHHRLFHLGEERVVGGGVHTALILVEQDVVGVARRVERLRAAAAGVYDALDIGLKGRPVVGELGAVPHGVRLAGELAPGDLLLGGDGAGLALVAAKDMELGGRLGVKGAGGGVGPQARRRASPMRQRS